MKNGRFFFIIMLLFLAACRAGIPATGGENQASATSDVAGIWVVDHPDFRPAYLILREEGIFTIAPDQDGSHGQSGTYSFDKGRFIIQDPILCDAPGVYTVTVDKKDGQAQGLVFTPVKDTCPTRERILTRLAPKRAEP